jgi:serine/threonine protein kinase
MYDCDELFQTKTEYPSDRYSYVRKIIDGSNSKLYVGYDKKVKKNVAIKRLSVKTDWYKELNILKMLRDVPNILSYTDYYKSWNYVYIITEYGGDFNIEDYNEINAPYSEQIAKNIFVKMLKCVKSIHDRNIAHLDIKCENFVMISSKIDNPIVMLIDFGHAEHIEDDPSKYTCQYGTTYYLCPEGYNHQYGFPSDIWSLGICFHLLLTGHYPFDEYGNFKKEIINDQLEISDNISIKAKLVIKMMLSKDPKSRPTVDHLLESKYFT